MLFFKPHLTIGATAVEIEPFLSWIQEGRIKLYIFTNNILRSL
ncbi:MAG: hypothetical protein ACP5LN_02105 [Thermoproteota archaeon]